MELRIAVLILPQLPALSQISKATTATTTMLQMLGLPAAQNAAALATPKSLHHARYTEMVIQKYANCVVPVKILTIHINRSIPASCATREPTLLAWRSEPAHSADKASTPLP